MEEKNLPKRKYPRLKEFDYSRGGAYFITVCTQDRKRVLSKIVMSNVEPVGWGLAPTAKIQKTEYGQIVDDELNNIETRFPQATLGDYVIMPNHIHLVLLLDEGAVGASPHPTVMDVICAFKSLATKKCKEIGLNDKLFQRSFYDRIIRNNDEYMEICNYIRLNPDNWETDELYN